MDQNGCNCKCECKSKPEYPSLAPLRIMVKKNKEELVFLACNHFASCRLRGTVCDVDNRRPIHRRPME